MIEKVKTCSKGCNNATNDHLADFDSTSIIDKGSYRLTLWRVSFEAAESSVLKLFPQSKLLYYYFVSSWLGPLPILTERKHAAH